MYTYNNCSLDFFYLKCKQKKKVQSPTLFATFYNQNTFPPSLYFPNLPQKKKIHLTNMNCSQRDLLPLASIVANFHVSARGMKPFGAPRRLDEAEHPQVAASSQISARVSGNTRVPDRTA